jgi:hypothetical protein
MYGQLPSLQPGDLRTSTMILALQTPRMNCHRVKILSNTAQLAVSLAACRRRAEPSSSIRTVSNATCEDMLNNSEINDPQVCVVFLIYFGLPLFSRGMTRNSQYNMNIIFVERETHVNKKMISSMTTAMCVLALWRRDGSAEPLSLPYLLAAI